MIPQIEYRDTPTPPSTYASLFATTGWNDSYGLTPEELAVALGGSWRLVTAWRAGRLVGTGRLISDGVQYALVVDVIVEPSSRRGGIGTEIVRRLLEHADRAGVRDVLLFAAEGTEPFYARLGFAPRPPSAPGMLRRRPARRAGDAGADRAGGVAPGPDEAG